MKLLVQRNWDLYWQRYTCPFYALSSFGSHAYSDFDLVYDILMDAILFL